MRSGASFSLITPHNPPNTTMNGVMRQKKLGSAMDIAAFWRKVSNLGPIKKRLLFL
ncbi:hypothetical protein Hanom_Chr10g00885731 [Helianthus anomalus]